VGEERGGHADGELHPPEQYSQKKRGKQKGRGGGNVGEERGVHADGELHPPERYSKKIRNRKGERQNRVKCLSHVGADDASQS